MPSIGTRPISAVIAIGPSASSSTAPCDRLGRRAHGAAARVRDGAATPSAVSESVFCAGPKLVGKFWPPVCRRSSPRVSRRRLHPARAVAACAALPLWLPPKFLPSPSSSPGPPAGRPGRSCRRGRPGAAAGLAAGPGSAGGRRPTARGPAAGGRARRPARTGCAGRSRFPRAHAFVLGLLVLVVVERRLQFVAQLLDLGHQRGDGIARRVAFDAQRLHLFGRERLALPGGAGLALRSPENSLMPTNTSTSAIGISSHFEGLLFIAAPPRFGLAGRRRRRQVHRRVDRRHLGQQRLGQAVCG